eukprot:TRINITY_DN87815_c0_g1_i1.p1 TRINITY_DN87815_c0_g1~~TRINITY_DN87815_c0_g1_i1.p1  ORF type:complete len:403 (+),score=65.95 TRINITY_DN87815_c0_g1_i1:42-1250(+)
MMRLCFATLYMVALVVNEANKNLRDLDELRHAFLSSENSVLIADDAVSIASLVALVKDDAKSSAALIGGGSQVFNHVVASKVPAASPKAETPAVASDYAPRPGPSPGPFGLVPGAAPAAPGPALGPAPGPAPAPLLMTAASPYGAHSVVNQPLEDQAAFTKRLVGVDYYLLSADVQLRKSFEEAVKAVLSAQVRSGLQPKDVSLRLSPGSVVIDAWFSNPERLSSLTKQSIIVNLCREANLDNELLAAVSALPGFKDVTTRETCHFDKAPQCKKRVAVSPARNRKPSEDMRQENPSASKKLPPPTAISRDTSCNPACVEGQGICEDNICFCRHPYTGARCEEELHEEGMRISWMYVTIILCAVLWLGMLLGECIFCYTKGDPKQQNVGKSLVVKEVWRPQNT